jgi:(1->4)-alpha-D-glucan 1-alpha-D-glucosylmutase
MQKATKEGKVHTSWVNPNEEYDAAVREFTLRLLTDAADDPFRSDLLTLQRRVAWYGCLNSLAQLLLKLTSPGVPDSYQGTELWDLSLVDPDNRRPVDFQRRRHLLSQLKGQLDKAGPDRVPLVQELLAHLADGRIKMYLLHCTLAFRRAHERLFMEGEYVPMEASGERRDHVCAFARKLEQEMVVIAVPRLMLRLTGGNEQLPLGHAVWQDTRLVLPAAAPGERYRNLFTGEVLTVVEGGDGPGLPLADVFRTFPVALLTTVGAGLSEAG